MLQPQVCAPTGAGKTNIAMLALLQLINSHRDPVTGVIDKTAVKAVYIAPMKALAQEVVSKFSERLKPLGIIVREYTGLLMLHFAPAMSWSVLNLILSLLCCGVNCCCAGDMQLTKQEIMDAQLLVCTPEKYDVVTRKGGDKSLGE